MVSDVESVNILIDIIEKESTAPKKNPHYSMWNKDGKPAIKICLSNDDSGEVLISEIISTEHLLRLLKNKK